MTYRRIAALRTAADFRAHLAALGIELPFDETPLQPPPLPQNAALWYHLECNLAAIKPMDGPDAV